MRVQREHKTPSRINHFPKFSTGETLIKIHIFDKLSQINRIRITIPCLLVEAFYRMLKKSMIIHLALIAL